MKDNRIKEMQEYILLHQSVSLKELCDTFNVSMNTVRRYINEITADSARSSPQFRPSPQSRNGTRHKAEPNS